MYIQNIRRTDINSGETFETRKIIAIKKAKGDSKTREQLLTAGCKVTIQPDFSFQV